MCDLATISSKLDNDLYKLLLNSRWQQLWHNSSVSDSCMNILMQCERKSFHWDLITMLITPCEQIRYFYSFSLLEYSAGLIKIFLVYFSCRQLPSVCYCASITQSIFINSFRYPALNSPGKYHPIMRFWFSLQMSSLFPSVLFLSWILKRYYSKRHFGFGFATNFIVANSLVSASIG